ncbi:7TM diverse intracellular signaling domain-containing protein [Oligoflexus tunisiensis]|uniref:7TM diverse intracellular signaling domain-containing protein n=1 Tax=Oligoflexus tunisiensis TaxID=708132 RepID=UPI001C40475B|nr:7TM diverse intracellular signaling domain-containing protein [Oligoflexus tunisiensis]
MIIIALFLLWTHPSLAYEADPIVPNRDAIATGYSIEKSTLYLEDPNHSIEIEALLKPEQGIYPFKRVEKGLTFGYTHSRFWIQWEITNPDEKPLSLILALTYPMLDYASLYTVHDGQLISKQKGGDVFPYASRLMPGRNFTYAVEVPARSTRTFFMETYSSSALTLPLTLWEKDALVRHVAQEQLIFGLYFGALAALFFYNAFIYVSTGYSRAYAAYLLVMVSSILFYLAWTGFGMQIFWGNSQFMAQRGWPLAGNLLAPSVYAFQIFFLGLKQAMPRVFQVLRGMIIFHALVFIACLGFPLHVAQKLGFMSGALGCVVAFTISLWSAMHGNRQAKFFLMAWSVFLIFIALGAAITLVDLPLPIALSTYGSQIGSALECIVLAMGLADRINQLQKTRIQQSQKIAEQWTQISSLKDRLEFLLQFTRKVARTRSATEAAQIALNLVEKVMPQLRLHRALFIGEDEQAQALQLSQRSAFEVESTTGHPVPLVASDLDKDHDRTWCLKVEGREKTEGWLVLEADQPFSWADLDKVTLSGVLQSLAMALENISHFTNLELKVQEKTRDIRSLLQSSNLGIMAVVGPNLVIDREYSPFLEDILAERDLEGQKALTLLFRHSSLSIDLIARVEQTMLASMNEDILVFEMNSGNFPRRMQLTLADERQRSIDLDWAPVQDRYGKVAKILVTCRDVTEIEAVRIHAEEQEAELQIISQLIHISADQFQRFYHSSRHFLDENLRLIRSNSNFATEIIKVLFINIHTIKGSARTLGLTDLTDKSHQLETELSLTQHDEQTWNQSRMDNLHQDLALILDRYATVNKEKLNRHDHQNNYVNISRKELLLWHREIQQILRALPVQQFHAVLKSLDEQLVHQLFVPLPALLLENQIPLVKLSKDLMKEEPHFHIMGAEGLFLSLEAAETLRSSLVHILRNVMDHGIETAAERVAAGKSSKGTVQIQAIHGTDGLQLIISDDGRGLAIRKIREIAIIQGLVDEHKPLSALEIASMIFEPGFSTASRLTEISGRGVGLDAVKQYLGRLQGSIDLTLLKENPSIVEFVPFHMNIRLPGETCFFMEPSQGEILDHAG